MAGFLVVDSFPTIGTKMRKYEVHGRNGHWPIDVYSEKGLMRSIIIPRLPRKDAELLAGELNEAYRHGVTENVLGPSEEL
jgi:hypothetical protein